MLATVWDAGADPAGWWVSEKYDGVRGYWDGSQMLTRTGETIHIPAAWRGRLPGFPLDGELWAGRGRFADAVSVVRDEKPGPGWKRMHYMVFDAPDAPGAFEQRMGFLRQWAGQHAPGWLEIVRQTRCAGREQLQARLADVEWLGGEGLMLRAAGSPYEHRRSDYLRKYKSFRDTEATVIGYRPGKGKYRGMVGALEVRMDDGTRFAIGSGLTDRLRRNPPPIGSRITFKYYGLTGKGKPRFPVYWRRRPTL